MPKNKKDLEKHHQDLVEIVEKMAIPETPVNPPKEDQRAVLEDQKEKLESWGLEAPRSALSAQSIIDFIEAAEGMKGEHADLIETRKNEVAHFQHTYPRGTIVRAKHYSRPDDYAKVVDWSARTFEQKQWIHENVSARINQSLAPFQLVVLWRGGDVMRISLKGMTKIYTENKEEETAPESPELQKRPR